MEMEWEWACSLNVEFFCLQKLSTAQAEFFLDETTEFEHMYTYAYMHMYTVNHTMYIVHHVQCSP